MIRSIERLTVRLNRKTRLSYTLRMARCVGIGITVDYWGGSGRWHELHPLRGRRAFGYQNDGRTNETTRRGPRSQENSTDLASVANTGEPPGRSKDGCSGSGAAGFRLPKDVAVCRVERGVTGPDEDLPGCGLKRDWVESSSSWMDAILLISVLQDRIHVQRVGETRVRRIPCQSLER